MVRRNRGAYTKAEKQALLSALRAQRPCAFGADHTASPGLPWCSLCEIVHADVIAHARQTAADVVTSVVKRARKGATIEDIGDYVLSRVTT